MKNEKVLDKPFIENGPVISPMPSRLSERVFEAPEGIGSSIQCVLLDCKAQKVHKHDEAMAWCSPIKPPTLAQPTIQIKLDLACGQNCKEGFEGVDIWSGARHVLDLMKFPWPWAPDSVDEINCSHFVEHLPMVFVANIGQQFSVSPMQLSGHKEMLFTFFDECWRILKKTDNPQNPQGRMTVIVPSARSDRAFQDPTHRRFINECTFLYLNRDWRKMNKLDHYNVDCHFGFNVNPSMPNEIGLLHPEAQGRRLRENWNTTIDFHANLVALK